MSKVLVFEALNPVAKEFLTEKGYELVYPEGTDVESRKKALADVDAVIARTEKYDDEILSAAKNLKIIARYGIGYDSIDLDACDRHGVTVNIARGCNNYSVAEQTITLMLACFRQIVPMNAEIRKGNWKARDLIPTWEARYKTLGLIGVGAIGMEVAKIAHYGFQMKVVVFDKFIDQSKCPDWIEFVDTKEEMIQKADVVSIHVPLLKSTYHIMDKAAIALMKPTAILLNCGRGPLWDEAALYDALKEGRIAGAGTDVFEQEPPSPDMPLFSLPNYIGCPHTAALTKEATEAVAMNAAHAIDDLLHGIQPKNVINHPKKD